MHIGGRGGHVASGAPREVWCGEGCPPPPWGTGLGIGVGDGGAKIRGKYFSGNYYVKFGHFSGKNHVIFGNFVNFSEIFLYKNSGILIIFRARIT